MQNYLYTQPFDVLTTQQRQLLNQNSKVVYLDKQQSVPKEWLGDFFVILKGKIRETLGDEILAGLNTGDWFDSQHHATFTASEQTLLLKLDGKILQQVTEQNSRLKSLLFADLVERVAESEIKQAGQESQNLLHRRLSELQDHIRTPLFIDENDNLFNAVVKMNHGNSKHILVTSQQGIGMFTQVDVCKAIEQKVDFANTPVIQFTNFNLKTITPDADVSDALLCMLNNKVHRLPIVENDVITGVLGQTELLSFLSNHSNLIAAHIENAENIDELSVAVQMIGKFIRTQHQNGSKTYVVSRMVQHLNLHVFAKLWSMLVPKAVFDNSCVMVMGSEGRGEQIMRTDQDNALIIRDGFEDPNIANYAEQFNQTLNQLGYPLCTGGIMMNHSRWCLHISDFKQQVSTWFIHASGDDMMWLTVLMDAMPVCGDFSLYEELKAHFFDRYQHNSASNFINRFAKPMLQFGDGHSFWQKFTGGADSDIDLKKAGIFPIVHGTRTLALDHGITENSTKARLHALANKGVIEAKVAQNIVEALEFFLSKRLAVSLVTSDRSARKVNPNKLSALEKDLLKQSLAIVKDFKASITHRYRLDVF
ncbi:MULTISPECIES: DUF294 nucleotidyltransferase-like domain-containing protein [unclassified Acinetobacter]|uniref:DUF294 nucleotidyltransferase-like domain-containing protein n=1 Tax=unclassified Acinetobacter TaxID=196816 RepID=UPI0035B9BBBC